MTRYSRFGALVLLVGGCGDALTPRESSEPEGTSSIVLGNHDSFPSGVASYLVSMSRVGGGAGCGAALSTFTVCSTALLETVTGLCSGDWQLNAPSSGTYASVDCSGGRLAAGLTLIPDPVTVGYGAAVTAMFVAQGASTLVGDVTFAGSPIIPAGAQSISIRARHTPHPDVGCGTAQTDIADLCTSFAPGTDFPPQGLTASGCSGTWTFCASVWSGAACSGAVSARGLLGAGPLNFGDVSPVVIDTSNLGPVCPF